MQAPPQPVRPRSSPLWTVGAALAIAIVAGLAIFGRLTAPDELSPTPPLVASESGSPSPPGGPDPAASALPSARSRLAPVNDPRVASTVSVGLYPIDLAVGEGGVWVADTVANTVVRIDPATNLVAATIRVPANPRSVAIGAGFVWVACYAGDAVVRIDPATDAVTMVVPVPAGPSQLAYGGGSVWVASVLGQRLARIDPASGEVTAMLPIGTRPRGVAVLDGDVWVGDAESGALIRVGLASLAVRTTFRGAGADRLVAGGGGVWAINDSTGGLRRIDPSNGSDDVIRAAGVQAIGFGDASDFGNPTPWLARLGSSTVQPLRMSDGALGDPIRVASDGIVSAIVGDGSSLWVADLANGTVVRLIPGTPSASSTSATK